MKEHANFSRTTLEREHKNLGLGFLFISMLFAQDFQKTIFSVSRVLWKPKKGSFLELGTNIILGYFKLIDT